LVIYGVAILAVCMIAGLFLGDLLGRLIGLEANVGGVGIAMLLMILLADYLRKRGKLNPLTSQGILFWSSIYIPVVVAMAAKQNVIAAVEGGPAAILAGVSAVAVGFMLVPVISRIGTTPVPAPGSGPDTGAPPPASAPGGEPDSSLPPAPVLDENADEPAPDESDQEAGP
jgi:malonate transporter MadL subunit